MAFSKVEKIMPCIEMDGTIPEGLDPFAAYQVYNILDSAITVQLLPEIKAKMSPDHLSTYKREMKVLQLCLEMSTKGFPIDQFELAEMLYQLEKDEARALSILHKFCEAIGARPINPNSTKDVPWLFYEFLRLPPVFSYDRKTKERKITSDIKALEKLRANYPIAIPFVNAILSCRESRKMASVFKRGLEPNTFKLRCSFSPSGTETGRLSSQQNPYQRGTNAQNLTDRVRQVITAPEGYAILNIDLKTAESIAVGYISGDKAYIDACLTGDVHTAACRLNWPDVAWTGDLKKDKKLAEEKFYRDFSRRDLMKRGGHGSNYYGAPRTLAMETKTTVQLMADFQASYFAAFPGIPEWHMRTIARIQQSGTITTRLGRERRFWGRPDDPATWREAIAFEPQSLVADIMNEGLCNVQAWIIKERLPIDLVAQVHDAGVFILPISLLDWAGPEISRRLIVPVDFGELGTMVIPSDSSVGKHWCKDKRHPHGLKDWKPGQKLHW